MWQPLIYFAAGVGAYCAVTFTAGAADAPPALFTKEELLKPNASYFIYDRRVYNFSPAIEGLKKRGPLPTSRFKYAYDSKDIILAGYAQREVDTDRFEAFLKSSLAGNLIGSPDPLPDIPDYVSACMNNANNATDATSGVPQNEQDTSGSILNDWLAFNDENAWWTCPGQVEQVD